MNQIYYYYPFIMTGVLILLYLLGKYTKYRNLFIAVNVVVDIIYIVWRITVIPTHSGPVSFIFGCILYRAEALSLVAFLDFQFLFTSKYSYEKKDLSVYGEEPVPFVDVLICTYNEPLPLLEVTMLAALDMDYPKDRFKVHICDDGSRERMRQMCEKYSVGYITRDDNKGAKAGNINNAIRTVHGDLFAVLDADMVPTRAFLKRTVGYFANENLAFVQTPQVYYNQDMYQYNLKSEIPNEQDFFMRDIQEARAAKNAVLHVGTNAVFRRSFVLEIGGYPTYSITEDMAVGMKLQATGHDSLLVNEELVCGLSATTFEELVKQRDRWCRGNLQVLKHYNILFDKGMSFAQKLIYIDGGVYWLMNLVKMVFMISPLVYLITGNLVLDSSVTGLLSIYLPYILGQILSFNLLSPRTRSLRWAHYYEVIMAPHLSMSVIKEMLNLKIKFNVTQKDMTMEKGYFQLRMVLPHIIIIVLTILGWGISLAKFAAGKAHISALVINMAWSLYSMMGLVIAIKVAYQKPIFRSAERIPVRVGKSLKVNVRGRDIDASFVDISNRGAQIALDSGSSVAAGDSITLVVEEVSIPRTAVRVFKDRIAVKFEDLPPEAAKKVVRVIVNNIQAYFKVKRKVKYQTPARPTADKI